MFFRRKENQQKTDVATGGILPQCGGKGLASIDQAVMLYSTRYPHLALNYKKPEEPRHLKSQRKSLSSSGEGGRVSH